MVLMNMDPKQLEDVQSISRSLDNFHLYYSRNQDVNICSEIRYSKPNSDQNFT